MSRKASVSKLRRKPLHDDLGSEEDDLPLSNVVKKEPAKKQNSTKKNVVREIPIKVTTNDVPRAEAEVAVKPKKNKAEVKVAENQEKTKTERVPAKRSAVSRAGGSVAPKRRKFELSIDDFNPQQKCDLLLTCGDGDTGQLGLGEDVTTSKRPRLIQTLVPDASEFLQIAAGGMHTVVLTANNEVYTCGCNDEGALGRVCFNDDDVEEREDDQDFKLRRVQFDDGMIEKHGNIVQISAGDSHTAALTRKGSVIIWGTFRDKGGCLGVSLNDSRHGVVMKNVRPVLLSSFVERRIVKISSGDNHLALLSKDGVVLTVGAGDAGQLGRLAPQKRDSSVSHRARSTMLTPKEVGVRSIKKVYFENLWCAGYSCYARSTDGAIYVWGLNNHFQLGFVPNDHEQNDVHQPVPSEQFTSTNKWIQFAGYHHILALNENGEVFGIGRGDDYRLGFENENDQQVIIQLKALEDVKGVSAGNSSSFAWTKEGAALAWGINHGGELGLGVDDGDFVKVPTRLNAKSLEGCKIVQISAGGPHTILMARKVHAKNDIGE